jgi:hypothetical protein
MGYRKAGWAAGAALFCVVLLCSAWVSAATIVAYDAAADPVYTSGGNYHNFNGGFGLGPWQTNGFPVGGNPNLQAFVSTSSVNGPPGPDIDTAGRAWGNNAVPGGNTFLARRSLLADLTVGGTFSILMDTGSCDGREQVQFGLNNSAMCQFYFDDSTANYQFYDAFTNTTIDTGILQTFGGLKLTVTRLAPALYDFQAVRLTDSLTFTFGGTYDTSIITGIRTILVSNQDGGANLGHSMYVNSIEATIVPEPAAMCGVVGVTCIALLRRKRRP